MMKFVCPLCGIFCTYKNNLHLHLHGAIRSGGHQLDGQQLQDAMQMAEKAEAGPTEKYFTGFRNRNHDALNNNKCLISSASAKKTLIPRDSKTGLDVKKANTTSNTDTSASFLAGIFELLISNKNFPKYQFERRVDIFMNFFLAEILDCLFGGPFDFVAPELPLKLENSNQSTNFDYLYYRGSPSPEWWLIELKTDSHSVSSDQFRRYEKAARIGMDAILSDIRIISRESRSSKYGHLIESIVPYDLKAPVQILYIVPDKSCLYFQNSAKVIEFKDMLDLELNRYPQEWEVFKTLILRRMEA